MPIINFSDPGTVTDETRLLVEHCCSLSMKANHAAPASPFLHHVLDGPSSRFSVFAFPGSWSVDGWIDGRCGSFGDSDIDPSVFPSLKNVSSGAPAAVNVAFLRSFRMILETSRLEAEVMQAAFEKQQIVFTGHSSGSAVAVLAAIWLLEKRLKFDGRNQMTPLCITFGSPLIGDHVFCHALQRENWSCYFLNFVLAMDIVPLISMAPLSSLKEELQTSLQFLYPKSLCLSFNSFGTSQLLSNFYSTVLQNALTITNHQSCLSMGCETSLLRTLSSFVKLTPYRPLGSYVFCCRNGRLIHVKNSDCILQILFYSSKGAPEQEMVDVAYRSFKEHQEYVSRLKSYLAVQNVLFGGYVETNAQSLNDGNVMEMRLVRTLLEDLDMSKEAKLHLHAAFGWEKKRLRNEAKLDAKSTKIHEALNALDNYRNTCKLRGLCYYDAFKLHRDVEDFHANINRLDLTGLWDEIIEMLSKCELPDGFEVRAEWVNLGNRYRRVVEPLDIANYYRHSKNEDTGPYMIKGRPWRYKCTQRWEEHAQRMSENSSLESCFWAMVEELCAEMSHNKPFAEVKERVLELEKDLLGWLTTGKLHSDVLLDGSTFALWWKALPEQHRLGSCIAGFMNPGEIW